MKSLVLRAQDGDLEAYGELVQRFQDMVYGYAYAILGDFHLAEDAAQEAFIEAYRSLPKLRNPDAFPGWLRRIVFKRCDRLTRGKRVLTVPLEAAENVSSDEPEPAQKAQLREMRDAVLQAIRSLPEDERTVTALYYINGYSHAEVAQFLEVPATTVNNRLHSARRRLKERMMAMVADTLGSHKPSPEQRQAIMDELMARRARFQADVATFKPDLKWAAWWHERRMKDVRSNAAQYGIRPDEDLPRMEPEHQQRETFRHDFKDVRRRWGIPEETKLTFMRELCREVGVKPLALCRWEAEGLPVIRYFPWSAYDASRIRDWIKQRGGPAEEKMSRDEAREPLLLTLRSLAAGEATIAECKHVLQGLETSTIAVAGGKTDTGGVPAPGLDPVWAETWAKRRPEDRKTNARQYGLAEPADNDFGVPENVHSAGVFEIRDLSRRLGVSPFDVIRWTREGMPSLRCSPWVRWDIERVTQWLAERGALPDTDHSPKELDALEDYVLPAVAGGEASPEEGREIFTVWLGLM